MKRLIVLLMICIVMGAASTVFAAGSQEESGPEELVVAMELQYPPFEMSDEQGNPAGISVDMAHDLGEYLGRPVRIENTAWTGLIPSLQTGKADIILSSMTINEERAQVVDFSDPYLRAGLTLLINADSPVERFSDLNQEGRVVAVKSGTIGVYAAEENLPKADIRIFEEVAACVLEVSQGKADAFLYDALTVLKNHRNHPDSTRMNLNIVEGTENYWGIAIEKGNDQLREQINAFLASYREEGKFDELAQKYLSEERAYFEESGIPFFFDLEL
jgi:polar amino acid transport system substrate-binding protein